MSNQNFLYTCDEWPTHPWYFLRSANESTVFRVYTGGASAGTGPTNMLESDLKPRFGWVRRDAPKLLTWLLLGDK